jgi:DNA-directed RNA polymerase subunit RPC12/RpoP
VLITGIKSKPVYAPLRADTSGRHHCMLGLGVGAAPLLRVVDELRTEQPSALLHTEVLYTPGATPQRIPGATPDTAHDTQLTPGAAAQRMPAAEFGAFAAAGVTAARLFADSAALLREFRRALDDAFMGTRLYVAGPQSFIGLAMQIALEFDLNLDEIRAEECGSLARRVWCVHCRTTVESVTTNIVRCPGCERWLLVRDHYSRRLAAYMGVMVDAEVPGERPPIREVFP